MQMQQQQLLDRWMKRHRAKCWHEEGCVRGLLAEMKGPTEAEVERQGGVGAGRLQAALKPELGGSSACAALELEPDPEGRKGGLSDPGSRGHCRPGQGTAVSAVQRSRGGGSRGASSDGGLGEGNRPGWVGEGSQVRQPDRARARERENG